MEGSASRGKTMIKKGANLGKEKDAISIWGEKNAEKKNRW